MNNCTCVCVCILFSHFVTCFLLCVTRLLLLRQIVLSALDMSLFNLRFSFWGFCYLFPIKGKETNSFSESRV